MYNQAMFKCVEHSKLHSAINTSMQGYGLYEFAKLLRRVVPPPPPFKELHAHVL